MRSSREINANYHLLEVITAITDGVNEPSNAKHIGTTTLEAIINHFHPAQAYLHTSDSIQKAFHMLNFCATDQSTLPDEHLQYIPYDSQNFIAQVLDRHEPLLIEEMRSALQQGIIQAEDPFVQFTESIVTCVPLWFGDQFEGALTAIFDKPISAQDPEIIAFGRSGPHIAAALAHAHLLIEVEDERARLQTVLDQLPEGVLITESSNGLVSYANSSAESLLDIPHSDLVGNLLDKHLQERSSTSDPVSNIQPWNFVVVRALSGETIKTQETLVVKQDESRAILLCSSAPLLSANNMLTGAVLVFQDVTQQKSLEQLKDEFLAMASHELRTPITTIQGLAEILQMYYKQGKNISDMRSQRAITQIANQCKHLTHLITEMLDLSRIEQSRFQLKKSQIDLVNLLKEIVEEQSTVNLNHQIFLSIEEDKTHSLIADIDKDRITQALNNLISNAIKYNSAQGSIEVGLRKTSDTDPSHSKDEVLIWIKDSGIGIAKEDIPHIFERFYRANSLDPSYAGLGIGLFLVKETVTRHEGRVWVESEIRKGSTFYIALPL